MPRISLRQDDWQRAKRRLRAIQRELGATEAQFRNSLPAFAIPALATAKRLAPRKTGRLRRELAYSIVGDDVQLGTNDPDKRLLSAVPGTRHYLHSAAQVHRPRLSCGDAGACVQA